MTEAILITVIRCRDATTMTLIYDYRAPDISDMDMLFSIAEEDLKKYGDDFLVELSGYNGIWEKAYQLTEIEQFMYLLAVEPEKACYLMDVICEYKVESPERQ